MKRLIDLQKGDTVYLYDETKNIVEPYEVEAIHELSNGLSPCYNIRRVIIRAKKSDEVVRLKFYYYTDTDECEVSQVDEVIDENDIYLEKIIYVDNDEMLDELQRKLLFIKEQMEKVTQIPYNLC